MKLSDIFSALTHGELSQLAVGGKKDGGIYPYHSDEICSYINLGLNDLFSRFPLRYEEAVIQQKEGVTLYHLRKEYALSNTESTEPHKYIIDSPFMPFNDNVIKIERVMFEDGVDIELNTHGDTNAVYTPSFDTIQSMYGDDDCALSVVYRAGHPKVFTSDTVKPEDIEVELPPSFLRPLLLYVANRAYTALGTQEALTDAASWYQQYEAALLELENNNVISGEHYLNYKLWSNGWV